MNDLLQIQVILQCVNEICDLHCILTWFTRFSTFIIVFGLLVIPMQPLVKTQSDFSLNHSKYNVVVLMFRTYVLNLQLGFNSAQI